MFLWDRPLLVPATSFSSNVSERLPVFPANYSNQLDYFWISNQNHTCKKYSRRCRIDRPHRTKYPCSETTLHFVGLHKTSISLKRLPLSSKLLLAHHWDCLARSSAHWTGSMSVNSQATNTTGNMFHNQSSVRNIIPPYSPQPQLLPSRSIPVPSRSQRRKNTARAGFRKN